MPHRITTITLPLPYRLGNVNCYLVETGDAYVLIDTGCSNSRTDLDNELDGAGCRPGNLALIVLTHGDFDHAGNAACLRAKYGAPIAMHSDDVGMVERGDLFAGRKKGPRLVRLVAPVLFRFGRSQRFSPDLRVEDGQDLSGYGFEARVISLPGHSKGSVGVLTADADLFCGDLLMNTERPSLNSIMDDAAAADASVERLRGLGIRIVYPGHGVSFPIERVTGDSR